MFAHIIEPARRAWLSFEPVGPIMTKATVQELRPHHPSDEIIARRDRRDILEDFVRGKLPAQVSVRRRAQPAASSRR